jgi:hypothetical protein
MSFSEQWIRAVMRTVPKTAFAASASLESREDCVRKDLTRRLEHICEHLSRADFAALILDMTREQLRGEGVIGRKTLPC